MEYERRQGGTLARSLAEPRRFIQVVSGPRQVGKTTLVHQVTSRAGMAVRFASADDPSLRGPGWIAQQWEAARLEAGLGGGILVLDEVQKAADWADAVKKHWDEDSRVGRDLRVVLLSSAPLLVQRGLAESLAGRFELIPLRPRFRVAHRTRNSPAGNGFSGARIRHKLRREPA